MAEQKNPIIKGNISAILEEMILSNYQEHNMIIYPNKSVFRNICSEYCKALFFEKNSFDNQKNKNDMDEIVLLLPFYDTVNGIRYALKRKAGINVEKYEKEGSIVIVDSLKAYSSFSPSSSVLKPSSPPSSPASNYTKYYYILHLFRSLLERANHLGKRGIAVIADMGPFYLLDKVDELVRYETSFLSKTDCIKCKAFCSYHKDNFHMLSLEQRERLLEHHYRNLIIHNNSGANNDYNRWF